MEQWERDRIRSANDGLKSALAEIQEEFDEEIGRLGDIQRKLAAMKIRATSPNELATVTVNSSGLVLDITIAADAFRRSSPEQLSRELNATIRGAVEAATQAREQLLAPMMSIVDGMADLSEIVPGAPSIRELRAKLSGAPQDPEE